MIFLKGLRIIFIELGGPQGLEKKGSALSFISENDKNIWKNIYKLIDTNENKTYNSENLIGKSFNSKSKNVINKERKKKYLKDFKRKSFRSDDDD